MIIVELTGGLGNQMFQYAAGVSVVKRLGLSLEKDLKLDISFLNLKKGKKTFFTPRSFALDQFRISARTASFSETLHFKMPQMNCRSLYHIARWIWKERAVFAEGKDDLKTVPESAFLSGYWQNASILKSAEPEIRSEFQFRNTDYPAEYLTVMNSIKQTENPVCISFRRGDYVGHAHLGFLTLSYYRAALRKLSEMVAFPLNLFVFSDDIDWCKKNFHPENCRIRYMEPSVTGGTMQRDLDLMKCCKYFIIPNSTFHFWGAYLSETPGKTVIVPNMYNSAQKEMRSPIWPSDWMGVDTY